MNIESLYCTSEMNMFYQLHFNLKRERETHHLSFSTGMYWGKAIWSHNEMGKPKPREKVFAGPLIFFFQATKAVSKYMLFKPPSLWYCFIAAWETGNTYTNHLFTGTNGIAESLADIWTPGKNPSLKASETTSEIWSLGILQKHE